MNILGLLRQTAKSISLKLSFIFLFVLAAVILFTPAGMAAWKPCLSFTVSNQKELNTAIAKFNASSKHCVHTITLTDDIVLSSSTIPIDKDFWLTRAGLRIDGDGFSVNGQTIEGVCPFEISAGTRVTMKNVIITGGNSIDLIGGGGIINRGGLTLIGCTISNCIALNRGGGIFNFGSMSLDHCNISSNTANQGGGINNHGTLTISDSTVANNEARGGGGIANETTLTIMRSTISGNYAVSGGGGIDNLLDGTLDLVNSTISSNEADRGGGILNQDFVTITNCTLSHNRAGDSGGGINNHGTLIMDNTIVANSHPNDCTLNIEHGAATVIASYSLFEDSIEDACYVPNGFYGNITGVDPLLGELADNSGPTKTHALHRLSPAVNAGDDDLAVDPDGSPLATDQRGKLRRWIRVDIGAYELLYLFPIPLDEFPLP